MTASVKAFDSMVDSDHSSGVRILLFLSQVVKDYLLHHLHGTSLPYQECTELVFSSQNNTTHFVVNGTAHVDQTHSMCNTTYAELVLKWDSYNLTFAFSAVRCLSIKKGSDCLTQALYFILPVHTDKYDLD